MVQHNLVNEIIPSKLMYGEPIDRFDALYEVFTKTLVHNDIVNLDVDEISTGVLLQSTNSRYTKPIGAIFGNNVVYNNDFAYLSCLDVFKQPLRKFRAEFNKNIKTGNFQFCFESKWTLENFIRDYGISESININNEETEQLLNDIPDDDTGFEEWLNKFEAINSVVDEDHMPFEASLNDICPFITYSIAYNKSTVILSPHEDMLYVIIFSWVYETDPWYFDLASKLSTKDKG